MFLRFESASVLTLLVLCLQKEEENNFLLVELAALYSNVYTKHARNLNQYANNSKGGSYTQSAVGWATSKACSSKQASIGTLSFLSRGT